MIDQETDPLGLFHRRGGRDWKDMIEDLAGTAWEAADSPSRRVLDEWLVKLRADGYPGWSAIDSSVWSVVFGALAFGARYGYGLAKSFPDAIEKLPEWPTTAWEVGAIPEWIARERQSNLYPPPKRIAH